MVPWWERANVFNPERRRLFGVGAQRLIHGDVSRAELSSAIEAQQRDILPNVRPPGLGWVLPKTATYENFFVGSQRLLLGVTGENIPGVPGTQAEPQHVPTPGEVVRERVETIKETVLQAVPDFKFPDFKFPDFPKLGEGLKKGAIWVLVAATVAVVAIGGVAVATRG